MSATPILSLEQEPPKPRLDSRSVVNSVIVLVGMLAPAFIRNSAFNHWLWLPAMYAGIVVHELGHAIASRLAGIQAGGIGAGGFTIFKSSARWRFGFEFARLFGGVFIPLPGRGVFRPAQYGWMIAGGPLATILLAAISKIAILRFGGGAFSWRSSLFWADCLLIGFMLLPDGSSDVTQLWLLRRDPARSRSVIAMLQIHAENAGGVLPRAWNPWIFEEMLRMTPSAPEYFYCQLLAFYRRRGEGKTQEALDHLENVLSASANSSRTVRHACFAEAARACALVHHDAGKARTWLERAVRLRESEPATSAEAAIAVCERRYSDAIRLYDSARDWLLQKRLDSGIARFEIQRIAKYQRKCLAAQGRASLVLSGR